jgi:hypothetical protein
MDKVKLSRIRGAGYPSCFGPYMMQYLFCLINRRHVYLKNMTLAGFLFFSALQRLLGLIKEKKYW